MMYHLGKAIDITQQNVWAKRLPESPEIVNMGKNVDKSIDHRFYSQTYSVESHIEYQCHVDTRMEVLAPTPIGPVPAAQVHVAADMSRKLYESLSGKYTLASTARYSLLKVKGAKSNLQDMLEKYPKQKEDSDVEWCRKFLEGHRNMTHYISSITLGAMKFSVTKVHGRQAGYGGQFEVNIPGAAGLNLQRHVQNVDQQSCGMEYMRGKFCDDEKTVDMPEVIIYEYEPLSNLVSEQNLKDCLDQAVLQYRKKRYTKAGNYTCSYSSFILA